MQWELRFNSQQDQRSHPSKAPILPEICFFDPLHYSWLQHLYWLRLRPQWRRCRSPLGPGVWQTPYGAPPAPLPKAVLLVPVVTWFKAPGPTATFVPVTTRLSCRSVICDWSTCSVLLPDIEHLFIMLEVYIDQQKTWHSKVHTILMTIYMSTLFSPLTPDHGRDLQDCLGHWHCHHLN